MPFQKGRSGNAATQFKRGRSGNPAGRPLGLTRYIRETTGEGAELVDFMLAVFRGENIPNPKAESQRRGEIDLRDRIAAATWLADRAFGRPGQVLDNESPEMPPSYDLSRLSLEELRTMQSILGKAASREVIDVRTAAVLAPYSRAGRPPGPLAAARRDSPLTPP